MLVTDSTLDELDHFADTPSFGKQALALKALSIMTASGIQPTLLTDRQNAIARLIAHKLLEQGIIPPRERNDAFILAEAAVLGCQLLVSSDSHLRDADRARLERVLLSCGVSAVVVRKPDEIVRQFPGR